jgi:methylase of polypeptide subunit release factors
MRHLKARDVSSRTSVPIEIERQRGVQTPSLRFARRLGRQLLTVAREHTTEAGRAQPNARDAHVTAAFTSFLQQLENGEAAAVAAQAELRAFTWSPHAEAHFLELLQAEADRAQRKQQGMYFTPGPVVEHMLRRIAAVVPGGPLRIVDPACGAGVFLLAAASLLQGRPGSALIGFDLSPAAAQATRTLLQRAGVVSGPQLAVHVECANPLTAGDALAGQVHDSRSTLVVVGNPPYANYGRRNQGPWIHRLLGDYRAGLRERKLNLTDDFIKFLRWGQYWIDQAPRGVLAMITSRTYLAGLTHRGLRRSLLASFNRAELLDLHGDGESGDENVFAIRRGVAIGIYTKTSPTLDQPGVVSYSALRGTRGHKLQSLHTGMLAAPEEFTPHAPEWRFVPAAGPVTRSVEEYERWPRLDEIFPQFISGVQTKNDALFVDFERPALAKRMQRHLALQTTCEIAFDPACLQPYVVGPCDQRWIYYEPRLLGRARWPVMQHLLHDADEASYGVEPPIPPKNVALVFMRQSSQAKAYDHAWVVDSLASDRVFYSRRGAPFLAPLWCRKPHQPPTANLQAEWVERCRERCQFPVSEADLFAFLYGVLWSPTYRRHFLSQLQGDFPRIPWPRCGESFARLADSGGKLIALHLEATAELPSGETAESAERLLVERGYPRWQEGMAYLNPDCGLRLTDEAWAFTVGGYRVIHRWLSVRRGRQLTADDLTTLACIARQAHVSHEILPQLDAAYRAAVPCEAVGEA